MKFKLHCSIVVVFRMQSTQLMSHIMAPINCCSSRRNVSPNPQPVRLVDTSQPKQRFTLSSRSITPIETVPDAAPILNISASAADENGRISSSTTSGQDLLPLDDTKADINCRYSSRKLHGVASQIRKKMSHDSGVSRQSSKRALRTSMSLEDTNRRAELRRALHRRVEDSLQDDSTVDDDHYDEDAVSIKTPSTTWCRRQSSIHVKPTPLSDVLERSDSTSAWPQAEQHQREVSQTYVTNHPVSTLSRMLTQRADKLVGGSEHKAIGIAIKTPKRSQSKKYVFEDEETPKAASQAWSQSPLGRSSTVIRAAPGTKQVEIGIRNPPLLHQAGELPFADLSPSRTPSISNSLATDQRCLPSSEMGPDPLPATSGLPRRPLAVSMLSLGIYDTRIRPASESWLHGASGLLRPSRRIEDASSDHGTGQRVQHEHSCEPNNEEADFGGIDGRDNSPPRSTYHTARTRNHSEGNETAGSAHIYNMHVPSRLASKALLPASSLPQLHEPKRQRSFTSGGSDAFSVKSRRESSSSSNMNSRQRTSSSGHPSPGAPMAWVNPHWRASSSVYNSQPESLMSSQQSSLRRIANLHDRLREIVAYTPSEEIISVPASKEMSIDLEKLERQTSDVSYHSSNESLLQRELAAAESRIAPLPRANTLPKRSHFKEELDSISAEIALTNPVRRRVSNLDGGSEWNRASQAMFDRHTASIWEKALRDHSEEDAALSHTRLGSDAPYGIGPKDTDTNRRSVSSGKAQSDPPPEQVCKTLSVGKAQRPTLQERLASYRLPSPTENPVKKPVVQETRRSASGRSTSSWARYPSHTREERSSSPAGEQDQVYARDFANMMPNTPRKRPDAEKQEEPTSFGKHMLSSLKHVYDRQSQELQRRLANEARGHRSSISVGGVLEYPELEMLGSMSPPLPSPDTDTEVQRDQRRNSKDLSPPNQRSSEDGAREWSKLYADCVVRPGNSGVAKPRRSSSAGVGPKYRGLRKGMVGSGGSDLRGSTLDFKRSLEMDEGRARERVLGMAVAVKDGEDG